MRLTTTKLLATTLSLYAAMRTVTALAPTRQPPLHPHQDARATHSYPNNNNNKPTIRPTTNSGHKTPQNHLLWPLPTPNAPTTPDDFTVNKGKAIDALRHDTPRILVDEPDFTIFTKDVELHDPSGKRLKGLAQYELVFDMIRLLRRTTMQDSEVTFRLDDQGRTIRLRWNAKLWVRDPLLGIVDLVHLDGVSAYELDADGRISQHRLENIVFSGKEHVSTPVNLHHLFTPQVAGAQWFQPAHEPLRELVLVHVAEEAAATASASSQHTAAARPLHRPGASPRARPPLASESARETPMERAARERGEMAAKAASVASAKRDLFGDKKKKGFLGALGVESCESNFDCDRPMTCCDLFVGKVCCGGGVLADNRQPSLAPQPIPIPVDDGKVGERGGQLPPQGLPPLP